MQQIAWPRHVRPLVLLPAFFFALSTTAAVVSIRQTDVPLKLRHVIPGEFAPYLDSINTETDRRVREGELEHLIYYVLQSRTFTREPAIEPAISAREYFGAREHVPAAVERRIADFRKALHRPSQDERLAYFQKFLAPAETTAASLHRSYALAMKFLYEKEVAQSSDVYERRGHSSDTQLASSYTVASALEVLKSLDPKERIGHVLLVGPGADFAPRTGYSDSRPPRTYQPFAIAATLFRLGLSDPGTLQMDCIDVNDRVLATVRLGPPHVLPSEPGDEEFMAWQRRLAADLALGTPTLHATRLNIVTQRFGEWHYNLIVATNILLYFPPPQLLLALANISAMLAPGGVFIHNDTRTETEAYTKEMGLTWVQARRILIGRGRNGPLYDVFAIVRK